MSDSPSAPTPVDPWTQAAAQYGLSTGTAAYNAGLNRTNQTNPLGSSTWSTTGGGYAGGSAPGSPMPAPQPGTAPGSDPPLPSGGRPTWRGGNAPTNDSAHATLTGGNQGLLGNWNGPTSPTSSYAGFGLGGSGMPARTPGGGPIPGLPQPQTYTLNTQLQPWAQSELQKPLDTSGLAGMPGGPSTTQDLQSTQDALYQRQMQYLAPEQKLASEQMDSKLANMGATVGSAAYNNEQDRLAREQQGQTSDARNQAIAGAGAEQSRLFGLGTQGLQNQIAVRNAPISEYNALTGAPGANATALTPDISGAFGQQYQGQLAGYNAGVATDNANTGAAASVAMMAAIYF